MKIYIVVLFLILYLYLLTQKEGFTMEKDEPFKGKVYRNEKIYDPFYAYNYDDIMLTVPYLIEMVQKIVPYFHVSSKTLCLGSKTGHLVQLLSSTVRAVGVDSSAMVDLSRYKYPDLEFVKGKVEPELFPRNSFGQVIVPLWNIHTIPNLNDLFYTLKEWTIHSGYLFVSFIDIKTFPVYKLVNQNPSEYFKENYEYSIEKVNNQLVETIQDRTLKTRKNIQDLYPHSETTLIYAARNTGFSHVMTIPFENIPMSICVFQHK